MDIVHNGKLWYTAVVWVHIIFLLLEGQNYGNSDVHIRLAEAIIYLTERREQGT